MNDDFNAPDDLDDEEQAGNEGFSAQALEKLLIAGLELARDTSLEVPDLKGSFPSDFSVRPLRKATALGNDAGVLVRAGGREFSVIIVGLKE